MSNIFIWPIDGTLSGATTLGQNGSESHGNETILRIPQSSGITRASPSECLFSYEGRSLWESCSSAEMQLLFYSPSRLGQVRKWDFNYIYIYIYETQQQGQIGAPNIIKMTVNEKGCE